MTEHQKRQCPIRADSQLFGCEKTVGPDCFCPVHGNVASALSRKDETGYGTVESFHWGEKLREEAADAGVRTHSLKVRSDFFPAIMLGDKPFEARYDDRNFEVGDVLILREWNQGSEEYTGRVQGRIITFKLIGTEFGIMPGFCVLGLSAGSS